jgi:glutaminyl-peptide cyclotransferase
MRRLVLHGALLAALSCGAGAVPQTDFDGAQALSYAASQVAFGPRVPNTEGHRKAGDWILEQLRGRTDSVAVQAFEHVTEAGDTLELRNFIGFVRPALRERVVYMAHWDTRPTADSESNMAARQQPIPGANDGASGVALLLAAADAFRNTPPAVGVDLVFVDGEDYGDWSTRRDVLLGSRHYAARLDTTRLPLFAVVWDMIGDRDLRIEQEANSLRGAPEIVERVWRVARELGYGRVFVDERGTAVTDDHVALLEAGVRAIDVIDFDYTYWHTLEDTIDKISAESLQIVGDVAVRLVR